MQKLIKVKDIQKLYQKIEINSNGNVSFNGNIVKIYEIESISLLKENVEYIAKIYNSFYLCLRGVESKFQIISLKDKLEITREIEQLKNRMSRVKNIRLKNAIMLYIQNLIRLSNNDNNQITKYYIVVLAKGNTAIAFKSLEEVGIFIKEINKSDEVCKILKSCILKDCL